MRKLLALLVVLAGAIPLFGQGTSFPVFNRQGWTMAGAVVSVCNGPADPGASAIPCTGLQTTTYVDWNLSTACTNMTAVPNPPGPPLGPTHGTGCTNPGLTDSHGNATIFAANGFYWAQVAGYQVVPQSFPFDIGSGGGGGGLTPCGQPTDIQNYFTNIALGCDTGIGILDPSQHLISENHLNANQQVSVGNGTANGLMCQGHSNGTAIDAAYCTQPSATFSTTGLGYGLFPPDNQPTGVGNVVTISSLTTTPVVTAYGTIGFYPTHFVTSVSGLVNAENLEYLFTTPCNLVGGSPCTDITFTPVPFSPSDSFMGPPQNTGNLGYVTNTGIANDSTGSLSSAVITLPNTYTTGDTLVAQVTNDSGGTLGTVTDTCGNTWTPVYAIGGQGFWYAAGSLKCLTADVITIPLGATGGFIAEAGEVVNGGILDTSVQGGSCSGSSPYTITYNSLTTAQPDILVVMEQQQGAGGGPFGTYAPGTGFTLESQSTVYGGGGLGDSRAMMIEWGPAASAGSHHATSIFTLSSGGNACSASLSYTLAFKPLVSTLPGYPTPRVERYADLAQADFPAIAIGNAGQPLIVDPTGTKLVLGSVSGGGTVTSSGSPVAGNIPKFTTATNIAPAAYTDIVALWASGSCSGYLKSDGTCSTSSASVAFSGITSATNNSATMVVGSGATLAPTSATAGVISANQLNGTALSGLSTGILRNTTTTGVPTASELSGDVTTSGSNATTLASTAVTPGSYTSTNLTVDAKGRITAAANGSGGGITTVTGPSDILTWTCVGSTCTATKPNQISGYIYAADTSSVFNPFPVQSCLNGTSTGGLNQAETCSLGQPSAAGNIFVGVSDTAAPGSATETFSETGSSDTWTTLFTNDPNPTTYRMSYVQNTAGGATAVISTLSGDSCTGTCRLLVGAVELSNVTTTSGADGSNTAGTSASVTTTNANDILVGFCRSSSAVTAVAPWKQLGTTLNVGSGTYFWAVEWLAVSAIGTYTTSWSGSQCDGRAYLAAFKAAFNASSTSQFQPMAFSMMTLQAFPGLVGKTPSSTTGDTQIDLHVGTPINTVNTTSALAGNDTASTLYVCPSGAPCVLHCWLYTSCHTTVSTATIIPALLWTDEQGTAETMNGATATCTTAGTNDTSLQAWPIRANASSTVFAKTTFANSPHADYHFECSLAGIK